MCERKGVIEKSEEKTEFRTVSHHHSFGRRISLGIIFGLMLIGPAGVNSSGRVNAQECSEPGPQTSGHHSFRRIGETFDIPITMADCQAISLTVRWSNGRNNGGLFNLTFFDVDNKPLYTKQISAFLTGSFEFPLSSFEYQPYGSVSVMSIPALVTIQAAPPFGLPATLFYHVTRANRRPRAAQPRLRGIDSNLVASLQTAPGRLIADTASFTLTEVTFAEPRELELHRSKTSVRRGFRLLLKRGHPPEDFSSRIDLIWIGDAALPVFRRVADAGAEDGAIIYDDAVLKHNAEIAVSDLEARKMYLLPDRLNYQPQVQNPKASITPASNARILKSSVTTAYETEGSRAGDEGNVVVGIKRAVRVIGGRRQPLVQVNLTTTRPFPARDSALRLQVGKRFFSDEVSGDHTGRTLTLTLTPEMFEELKDGADIVAFFNRPDRSGYADSDIWWFGRLNKSMLE
ncbi:MAG: hypothetical protein ACR2LM_03250 [Pyrinomonadaceae bacterium]